MNFFWFGNDVVVVVFVDVINYFGGFIIKVVYENVFIEDVYFGSCCWECCGWKGDDCGSWDCKIIFKICVFNKDVFVNNFGYEFVEVIGYVNKDNDDSVIFELEKICVGDLLDDGVIVVINGCSNWYGFF